MLRRLLGLERPEAAPAATRPAPVETADARDERLKAFIASLPSSLQAELGAQMRDGVLPDRFRSAVLDTCRPALAEHRPQRQRQLWRAVCLAAEPCLVADASEAGAWEIPRALLGQLHEDVAANLATWPKHEAAYAAAATPTARLRATRNAMTDVGTHLLSVAPLTGPRGRAVRSFAQMQLTGPHFFEIARATLGLRDEHLESLAFLHADDRPAIAFTVEQALAYEEAASRAPRIVPQADVLLTIQASLLVSPVALVLRTAPRTARLRPQMLQETTAAPVLDWVLWRIERLAEGIRRAATGLEAALAAGTAAEALALERLLEEFDSECAGLKQTVSLEPPLAAAIRLADARRRVADLLARKVLPALQAAVVAHAALARRDGGAYARAAVAAGLLGAAARLAKRSGQGIPADAALEAARAAVAMAAARVPAADADGGGRLICLAAGLDADATVRQLRAAAGVAWTDAPMANRCPRLGRGSCCVAAARALGGTDV